MPFSDIVNVEIDEILNKLTTEGAVNLIAGVGPLHAASIERLSVLAIKVIAHCISCGLRTRRYPILASHRGRFSKIFLEAVASRSVALRLDKYVVLSWNENSDKWVVEDGRFGFEWAGLQEEWEDRILYKKLS